jgi:hypothetical protein
MHNVFTYLVNHFALYLANFPNGSSIEVTIFLQFVSYMLKTDSDIKTET